MATRGGIEEIIGTRFDFLEPDEKALARFRPSLRLLVAEVVQQAAIFMLILAAAVAVFFYGRETGQDWLQRAALPIIASFLGINVLFILGRLVATGMEIYFTEYVITDRRTYSVTAIVSRRLSAIPFEKVTNIGLSRNLGERVINVDRVHLVAYGTKGTEITMRGVQDTREVFRRLQYLTRSQCTAENLLRMD